MVKDSDRPLITGFDDCSKHGEVMLSLAERENLGFCCVVHTVEVDAVQVRHHLFQVLGPVPDTVMTMMPVVDDSDMAVTLLVECPAYCYEVSRVPAPSAVVVEAKFAAQLCSSYGEGSAGSSSSQNIVGL